MLDRGPGRVAGVDYGTRRVGLALADGLRIAAHPVGAFPPEAALAELRRLDALHGLAVIAVGWPLETDGSEGKAVARVVPFFNRLKKAFPKAEVVAVDERLSSREAQERLHAAGAWGTVRRDKGVLDAEAACVLLEDYLRDGG